MEGWKRICVVLLVLLLSLALNACSDAELDSMLNFMEEWAYVNDIWDGENLDYGKLSRELAGDTVDKIVGGPEQTALEVFTVVDDIQKADELARQGTMENKPELIDQAIKLRPDDWTYRQRQAAMLLSGGDVAGYEDSTENSYALVQQAINNGADCKVAHRNYYEHQVESLEFVSDRTIGADALNQEVADAELWLDHPEDWPCK